MSGMSCASSHDFPLSRIISFTGTLRIGGIPRVNRYKSDCPFALSNNLSPPPTCVSEKRIASMVESRPLHAVVRLFIPN